jgi:hypothetical protein
LFVVCTCTSARCSVLNLLTTLCTGLGLTTMCAAGGGEESAVGRLDASAAAAAGGQHEPAAATGSMASSQGSRKQLGSDFRGVRSKSNGSTWNVEIKTGQQVRLSTLHCHTCMVWPVHPTQSTNLPTTFIWREASCFCIFSAAEVLPWDLRDSGGSRACLECCCHALQG